MSDPTVFVSLHLPDGPEIDVDGYQRQPIDLVPDPDPDTDVVVNGSQIEFPPFDSRVTIGRVGIWSGGVLLFDDDLYREYTIEAGALTRFREGDLEIGRDDLPPGLV